MDQPRLAVEGQQILVAHDVGDAGVDPPQDVDLTVDQFLAEGDELLLVDGGLLIRQDEEADLEFFLQLDDLVDHLLRVADAVIAPELPLRAERAGEGAAPRHVGNGDADAERDVLVLGPIEDRPVGLDRVQVLDGGGGGRGDHLAVNYIGEALDRGPALHPLAARHCPGDLDHDLLALAADDRVDMRGLAENLAEHEGRVHAAQQGHRPGRDLLGDLQHLFRAVDRGRDRRRSHDVGLGFGDHLAQAVIRDVMGHRVDEADIREPGGLQPSRQIGDPGRRPASGDLGAARMVVGVDEEDAHDRGLATSGPIMHGSCLAELTSINVEKHSTGEWSSRGDSPRSLTALKARRLAGVG